MKALILYAGFVITWTAAGVLIDSYIERVASAQIGTIVLLGMFFSGLVVSWIATVFVMDGSLNNFFAEREQLEAERVGKLYMNRTDLHD
jgi:RsiW-degrading membrane proteinase PrsW (M82 family)